MQSATCAPVGDDKTKQEHAAPKHQKTTGQCVQHMLGATIREPQINSFSVLRLHHDSKRLSISFDSYRLWRPWNQLRPLNRCDKEILGAWAYPQRGFTVIRICSQEENRIQSLAAGIALIRYFLGSKFSHLSN